MSRLESSPVALPHGGDRQIRAGATCLAPANFVANSPLHSSAMSAAARQLQLVLLFVFAGKAAINSRVEWGRKRQAFLLHTVS
ncbi:hypothetical protein [Bradyrhizobium zhanjiangense]|uniref:hypothetical protein n=1 Tax=Bradyrhizobium zhanjiangense TaxID=1325107 RepID=UPI001009C78C|nr:hypothetical protein [Bradyrhizobium zhanjiangense]